jgi:leader peptidase (prepilin peptidase)/N-methyltransferase
MELVLFSLVFLCIGSFISSVIYRFSPNISKDISIFFSRPFCPDCKKQIKLIYLIPVLGFILQKGKCKSCNNSISFSYPITELIFLFTGIYLLFLYGVNIILFFLFSIFSLFYILFFLDFKFYLLPFSINIFLIFLGFLSNYLLEMFIISDLYPSNMSPLVFSSLGFVVGYSSLWIINFIFKFINKKDGIGGGDFILYGALGSVFGPISLPIILFLGSLFGCFLYISFKERFKKEIPLGSCMVLGSFFYFIFINFELFNFLLVI